MKHDTIKTDNYLLVVDESEIKDVRPFVGKWHLEKGYILNKFPTYLTDLLDCKLVIAHLPLNGSPILEGVDLLPPLEEKEDIQKLFPTHIKGTEDECNNLYRQEGYNKAKEKYKYTEEDIRKAFLKGVSITGEGYNAEYAQGNDPDIECVFGEEADKFIQSLSQPKMPIGFERELVNIMGKGEPVTERNLQGHTQWVGTYIYG